MENKNNHLKNETSPYLLQHANNPVNWYPWNDKAFEIAKREDKPIFLSIGYSTCHWCHVMAHESFEDIEIAELLNKDFISIKVDREERPDIDSIYMNVAQILTGQGGWPLTIVMTPDKKPFFAGTYLPKHGVFGRLGMSDLLNTVSKRWKDSKDKLLETGNDVIEAVSSYLEDEAIGDNALNRNTIIKSITSLKNRFDTNFGGFGDKPKFPTPHNLMFLLHAYKLGLDDEALEIVEKTLDSMYLGGIFDHIGYGFSRYTVDEKWLIPHFEKMLYDNALLVIVYSEAYQLTNNEIYKYIVEKTLEYIEREMTSIEGGFYSAQDADSEGEEGKYYTWDYDEIKNILGNDGEDFIELYNISIAGNFENKNIVNLIGKDIEVPDKNTISFFEKLYSYRLSRYPLHKDDKILTSWNAMMIIAYAQAGRIFKNKKYIKIAERANLFIKEKMTHEDNTLYISYREGKASGNGLLDDYAYLIWANLELYKTEFNIEYLEDAINLYKKVNELFLDTNGGYFLSPINNDDLLFRPKEYYDGAIPSGNSIMAYVLSVLSKLTGDISIQDDANLQLQSFNSNFESQPIGYTFALKALLLNLYPTVELVAIIGNNSIDELKSKLGNIYSPQLSTIVITDENKDRILKLSPFTSVFINSKEIPLFYLCENYTCLEPESSIDNIINKLK